MTEAKVKQAGVMGWPIGHSRSPRLHGYWLKQYNIKGSYVPLAVPPENLAQELLALHSRGFAGVNLTIPHKETALKLVDHIDLLAKRTGAINTIIVGLDGSLTGQNTDIFGFSENLKASGFKLNARPAVILGAGGAARAVIVALQDMGCTDIRLVNRTKARAEQLAASFDHITNAYEWNEAKKALEDVGLLINTTSLGMMEQPPLSLDLKTLPKEAWVTDLVYAPLMTDLLKQANQKGHRVVDGLGMLLHQARPGFTAWFGVEPEVTPELRAHVLESV